MTEKGERRKARKAARAAGRPYERPVDRDNRQPMEFTESPRGRRALERWARWHDLLNGAPEGDWDR